MPAIRLPHTAAELGSIFQLAFVPQNFDTAIRFWTEQIGAGPFFSFEHMPVENVRVRGKPSTIDVTIAIGHWGDLQIELVRQHDQTPSCYKEAYDRRDEGVHHVCIAVDDFDIAVNSLEQRGGIRAQEMSLGSSRGVYIEMPGPSPLIEVAELSEEQTRIFAFIRNAARQWDGRGPVRQLPADWAVQSG